MKEAIQPVSRRWMTCHSKILLTMCKAISPVSMWHNLRPPSPLPLPPPPPPPIKWGEMGINLVLVMETVIRTVTLEILDEMDYLF